MNEEISKASITRYIMNWYLHRSQVKDSLAVLDLEPCYDFGTGALSADSVKRISGAEQLRWKDFHYPDGFRRVHWQDRGSQRSI